MAAILKMFKFGGKKIFENIYLWHIVGKHFQTITAYSNQVSFIDDQFKGVLQIY